MRNDARIPEIFCFGNIFDNVADFVFVVPGIVAVYVVINQVHNFLPELSL
jgi:hypothetical protein